MPVSPSTWITNNPITAHQLNQDLYTYDGSYFGANGVMFHSNKPMLLETYATTSTVTASKGGTWWFPPGLFKGHTTAISVFDSAALYGTGCDGPGDAARFASGGATAPGSSGAPGQPGGWCLIVNFIPLGPFSGSGAVYASGWQQNDSVLLDTGPIQPASTTRDNCGFAIDLLNRPPGGADLIYTPAAYAADPNGTPNAIVANSTSTCGETPRLMEIWCAVSNGLGSTVASIPSPMTVVTGATQLSSATLNTTIQQTFNLLNNPPILNCEVATTEAISANTLTIVPFDNTPFVDNYSGYNVSNFTYTVPLTGLYFCHATVIFNIGFTVGTCTAGFQVNGTSNFYGGWYNATVNAAQNTGCAVTKMLDLQAGDTISVFAQTTGNTNFGGANIAHFIMTWMSPVSSSVFTWTPPDVTGFQFAAGTSPGTGSGQLANIMNTKIANDINFVLNKPYLTAHQTTAQTSLASNTFVPITMNAVSGLVHGSGGDNYSGWSAAHNWYAAPVPGWYLAVMEVSAATTSTANSGNGLVAGFSVPTSGGINSPSSSHGQPDWYQHIMVTNTGTQPTGATAVGVYYLLAGETIAPAAQYQQSSGTWNTDVSHGFQSHFSVLWMSN